MKLYLFGYGKMGKEIEQKAPDYGFEKVFICDPSLGLTFNIEELKQCDVAIDYSIPDSAVKNIHICCDNQIPVIVGTTGWYQHLEEVKAYCSQKNGTVVYSGNFSIGVNILLKINEQLAGIMNEYHEYKVKIHEIHHTSKLDAPSGTAIMITNGIINHHQKYEGFEKHPIEESTDNNENSIPVYYERKDQVIGIHEVTYSSEIDQISIRHEAFNRNGFVHGTLIATRWAIGKKGFFTMNDVLSH